MFRRAVVALFAIASIGSLAPTDAMAGGGWRYGGGWALRGPAFALIGGAAIGFEDGFYGYPYGYPSGGYGEYAEYGPWAYGSRGGRCYSARQPVWTESGWLSRRIQICE